MQEIQTLFNAYYLISFRKWWSGKSDRPFSCQYIHPSVCKFSLFFFFTLLLLLNRYANINNIWYKLFLYEVNIVKIRPNPYTKRREASTLSTALTRYNKIRQCRFYFFQPRPSDQYKSVRSSDELHCILVDFQILKPWSPDQ